MFCNHKSTHFTTTKYAVTQQEKKKDWTLGGSFKEIMIEWGTSWTKKEGEFLLSLS